MKPHLPTDDTARQTAPVVPDLPESDRPIFDRSRSGAWPQVRRRRSAKGVSAPGFSCRNTERDRRPPRAVVTAQLMGDPPANRQR